MKQDLLQKIMPGVFVALFVMLTQPFLGTAMGQTFSDFSDQQIRFTPTPESRKILDDLKNNFDPETLRGGNYPPIWNQWIAQEYMHGIYIPLEAIPHINNIPIAVNDYIGGFFQDENGDLKCAGATHWTDTAGIVFPLFGDDPKTPVKDGFAFGEVIKFKLFSFENMKDYLVDVVTYEVNNNYPGNDKWAPTSLSKVVNMKAIEVIDFYISSSANPICEGNQIVLQGNEFIGSGGPYVFNWSSDPPGFNFNTQFPPPTTPLQTTTYHLSVNDGALQSNHELTVLVNVDPAVDAGSNASVCANSVLQLNGTSENTIATLWTTSGDGTFGKTSELSTTYTPGTLDNANGQAVLTLTGLPLNPCDEVAVDNLVATILRLPIVNAGTDKTVCTNESVILQGDAQYQGTIQWTTSGNGTFSSPTSLTTQYFGSGNDFTYGVTLTLCSQALEPCVANVCDAMHVSYVPGPTAGGPSYKTYCENQTVPLTGSATNYSSILWTTQGDGTFSSPSTFATIYHPGTNDKNNGGTIVTLNAFAQGNCAPATKDVNITLVKLPVITSFGNNAGNMCFTDTFMQLNATVQNAGPVNWSTNGDGTFNSKTILNPKYYPGTLDRQNKTFDLTLTLSPLAYCTTATSETLTVTIQDNPTAQAGADTTICQDQTLTLTGAAATSHSSVIWSTSGDGTFSNPTTLNPIYTPGTGDISNGTVQLTLTTAPISPCAVSASDSRTLTIIRKATVNAGTDATICETNTHTLSGSVNYSPDFVWSTSGDGTFSNINISNPIYTPGSADKVAGTVTLTLTAQQNAPCDGVVWDSMQLTIQRDATANAGNNATICETQTHQLTTASASNYSSLLWSTSGDGTFSSTTALKPVYSPGVADKNNGSVVLTLKATAISPCSGSITDSKTLTIIRQATADAGNDAQICETNTYTLSGTVAHTNSFVWSTSGDGTFNNPNALTPTYTPGSSDKTNGSVMLTLTAQQNAPCVGTPSDAMQLTIQRDVTANAGNNATICETQTHQLTTASASNYSSLLWSTNGDGTFSSTTALKPTYTPGAADKNSGSVVLTLHSTAISPCSGSITDSKTLTIIRQATADAGNDAQICETNTYTLSGTVAHTNSFVWSTSGDGTFNNPNALTPTYTPGSSDKTNGSVMLTLTAQQNAPCVGTPSDAMQLTIQRDVTANAGNNATICETSNHWLSTASASNYASLLWSTSGDGTFSSTTALKPVYSPGVVDKNNGSVILTLHSTAISPCSGSITDSKTLTIIRQATADAGNDAQICETNTYTLSGTVAHTNSFVWTTSGDGTFNNPNALTPTYTPGSSDKTNGSVMLTLTAQQNAPCVGTPSDAMQLTIQRDATANAGNNATICETQTHQLTTASASNYSSLLWSTNGDGTFSSTTALKPVYSPGVADKNNGSVILTLHSTAISPCSGSITDSKTLTIIRQATADAGNDAQICETNTYTLSGTVAHTNSFVWSTSGDGTFNNPNALTPTYTPGSSDKTNGSVMLTLTAQQNAHCVGTPSDAMQLTIQRDATANAGNNATICETSNHWLSTASASNYASLLWSTSGDGTFSSTTALKPVYTPGTGDKLSGSATLTLTAQSQSPCSGNTSSSKILSISPLPVVSAGNDVTVCADGGQLNGSAKHYASIQWSTSGDGTFSNASSLSPVYVPGPLDIASREAMLTLTAGSISPCTSTALDQVKMIIDVPQITSSSVNDQLLKTGNILVFTFNVSSAQPGQYAWYHNGNAIPGQTGRIMIIFGVMPANAGEYKAVFTNPCGVVESDAAMVTVLQPYAQQLTIPKGWSGISSFVTPLNPALETVFSPIANDLILMANNSGIYWPGQNINTLGNLEITEGYKIKMQNSAQVNVSGNVSYPLSTLTIPTGWSYLPVNTPCEENVEQFTAFPQIAMIKDIAGTGIYWPEMGINTIGNLIPGKAYFILNNSASPLVMKYQGCNGFKTSMVMPAPVVASPWPLVATTPVTHVFGFTREALAGFTDGDIIGAFDAKGDCMGLMQVDKMQFTNSLVVFGADNTDEFSKGMDVGELVKFKSLRQLENAEAELEVTFASRNASDGYFMENGISMVDRAACVTGIENHASAEAAQIKVYPNPTRGELTIALGNISLRDASVIITNQNGQMMLRQKLEEANTQLNLENLPRGIYHLRITTGTFVKVERIILN